MITPKPQHFSSRVFGLAAPVVAPDIFPGLRAGAIGILAAPPGTGKSYWLLELALSYSAGIPLFSVLPTISTSRRVLYITVEAENQLDDFLLRRWLILQQFPALKHVYEQTADNLQFLIYSTPVPPGQLQADIKSMGYTPEIIIIDTLSQFLSLGTDENDNVKMSAEMGQFHQLAVCYGCIVLIAHHTAKSATLNGTGDKQAAIRGASSITGTARLAMTLSAGDNRTVKLSLVKINNGRRWDPHVLRRNADGVLVDDFCLVPPPNTTFELISSSTTTQVQAEPIIKDDKPSVARYDFDSMADMEVDDIFCQRLFA